MAVHKLDLGEFEEIEYHTIAIHTSLEDYRLAFFINRALSINLYKDKSKIEVKTKEGEAEFSRFLYHDRKKDITWNLIQNKNEVFQQKKDNEQSLFSYLNLEVSTKVFLIPEFNKVDFFFKIENIYNPVDLSNTLSILNTIENIAMTYSVESNKIKSKNNLIF